MYLFVIKFSYITAKVKRFNMNENKNQQIAIFRYGIIHDFICGINFAPHEYTKLLQEKCNRSWRIPFTNGKRISKSTIQRWIQAYKSSSGNILSLYKKKRVEKINRYSIDPQTERILTRLKMENPYFSIPKLINEFKKLNDNTDLKRSTVYRFFKKKNFAKLIPESKKNFCKKFIRKITEDENKILNQWKKSNNKTVWQKAISILNANKNTIKEISEKIERPIRTIFRWLSYFNKFGLNALERKKRNNDNSCKKIEVKRKRIIEILHAKPNLYGINRSNWNLRSLSNIYEKQYHEKISKSTVSRLIKLSKYGFKKAKKVLTSPDPNYREKVELLLQTLHSLKPEELLFFVDEMGPIRIKKYGGRAFVQKDEKFSYPQTQTDKGSIIFSGSLCATTNQISWVYSKSKDSSSMIDLIEILFNQYYSKSKLYITWDAASWHNSNTLMEWLDHFNQETVLQTKGPIIEFIPLPSCSQFLDIIESVFSGMKSAVIHHSDYQSKEEMKTAISIHFQDRNNFFYKNPKRAGKKIWKIDFFKDIENIRSGNYREWK